MASVQHPAPLPDAHSSSLAGSDTATSTHFSHSRKRSRHPSANAAPLPAFSFNPGANVEEIGQPDAENSRLEAAINPPSAMKRAGKPAPLPDFTFNPGAELQLDATPSPTRSHPILEEMARNQQEVSRSARPVPLQPFIFSPATNNFQTTPSPTKTNFTDPPGSHRSTGHRRGASEFVGGAADNAQLVTTGSPQKSELRSPGPPVSGSGFRGHAHKRSKAISVSEINTSDLIKADAVSKFRSGSTPTTPSEPTGQSLHRTPQKHHSVSYPTDSPQTSPRRRESAPGFRPRVGFSEHIDFIPRPLSLISSETSGSSSTVRGYHSVSGSINSIAASPTPQMSSTSFLFDNESPTRRPQTADAAQTPVSSKSGGASVSAIDLPKRPLSASGSPVVEQKDTPSLRKKFWFSHSADNSPCATPKAESPDPLSVFTDLSVPSQIEAVRPKTSPERSTPNKVKARTWTNGIFSRKSRQRGSKGKPKRTATPPMIVRRPSDQMNEIFDTDNTIVIRDPSPPKERSALVQPTVQTAPIQPIFARPGNDISSPIIDLDAALGPFGSEEKFAKEQGPRSSSRFAKLHSNERRGVTDAFGVHRRAESAPHLPPVNRGTFGVHHLGSNASLVEQVFDEEEEDNFLAEEQEDGRGSAASDESSRPVTAGTDPAVKDFGSPATAIEASGRPTEGLGLSTHGADNSVFIVDSEAEVALDPIRASDSTIEAPVLSEVDIPKTPVTSPLEFAYPAPQRYYASSNETRTGNNSQISSPEADHISFDHQPKFNRYLGAPSPDMPVRASNDDLPSLTDSISTGAVHRFSSSANTRSSAEQRSASVSGPATPKVTQNWKRASLASLNRLIPGSANGSRLKFETTPDATDDEKVKKKSNRISKLMHFWRSKEKSEK